MLDISGPVLDSAEVLRVVVKRRIVEAPLSTEPLASARVLPLLGLCRLPQPRTLSRVGSRVVYGAGRATSHLS